MKFFIMLFLSLILVNGSDKDCKSVDVTGTNLDSEDKLVLLAKSWH